MESPRWGERQSLASPTSPDGVGLLLPMRPISWSPGPEVPGEWWWDFFKARKASHEKSIHRGGIWGVPGTVRCLQVTNQFTVTPRGTIQPFTAAQGDPRTSRCPSPPWRLSVLITSVIASAARAAWSSDADRMFVEVNMIISNHRP